MPRLQRLAHACRLQPPLSAAAAPRSAPAPSRAAADASPIPSIDVGALFGDDADAKMRTAQEIAVACEEIGFFSIHNHGVPTEIVEAAWQQTAAFFALPEATKQQAALMIADVYDYGYSPLGGETLAAGKQLELGTEQEQEPAPGDLKEMFAIGPLTDAFGAPPVQWPVAPAGIRPALTSYYREMEKLSSALLRAFALALELPEAWFEDKIDRHMCSLRTLSYPELEAETLERSAPGQLRASAHTDYGTLTLLLQGLESEAHSGSGLQVMAGDGRSGDWRDVPYTPGSFVVNLGDLMSRWTNERWVSTLHRVVLPRPEQPGSLTRRQSMAFFHNINMDANVECIPSCSSAEDPPHFPPIVAGEFLMMKHHASTGGGGEDSQAT